MHRAEVADYQSCAVRLTTERRIRPAGVNHQVATVETAQDVLTVCSTDAGIGDVAGECVRLTAMGAISVTRPTSACCRVAGQREYRRTSLRRRSPMLLMPLDAPVMMAVAQQRIVATRAVGRCASVYRHSSGRVGGTWDVNAGAAQRFRVVSDERGRSRRRRKSRREFPVGWPPCCAALARPRALSTGAATKPGSVLSSGGSPAARSQMPRSPIAVGAVNETLRPSRPSACMSAYQRVGH